MSTRYLKAQILEDLNQKLVLLGGPRQVGKTTFGLELLGHLSRTNPAYLNWDDDDDRTRILEKDFPSISRAPLVVLDEIHKYSRWRNYLKALYDKRIPEQKFLVTGSARLDHYRRGGDSLLGRHRYYRMHPFTLNELFPRSNPTPNDIDTLIRMSGFPEPLFKASERAHRLWQRSRISLVLREDLTTLETVRDVTLLEILMSTLPSRIGSPLSVKGLSTDLQVSFQTVERWLGIFESLYLVYRISPFGAKAIRAVKKEKKLYFWDWTQCSDDGARFENFVASHLLKYCHWVQDTEGYDMELKFLRDTDRREVDFVVTKDGIPQFAVECKTGEKALSKHIPYFSSRTNIPKFFQVHLGKIRKSYPECRAELLSFAEFSKEVPLV